MFLRGPSAEPEGVRALINAPFRYKHASFCSRRLQVSGPPLPENLWQIFSFDFPFKFALKTAIFGRSLAQLVLATLLLYPFGVKEGPERRLLSDVPFNHFSLVTYPSGLWAPGASWAAFWAPGTSWIGFWALVAIWGFLRWTLAASGFLGWILASKVLQVLFLLEGVCLLGG